MMTPPQLLSHIKAEPFRPFRVHMASGRTYDIRHPEMVKLGKSFLLVFSFTTDNADLVDQWDTVSLMLMESVSYLDAVVNA